MNDKTFMILRRDLCECVCKIPRFAANGAAKFGSRRNSWTGNVPCLDVKYSYRFGVLHMSRMNW